MFPEKILVGNPVEIEIADALRELFCQKYFYTKRNQETHFISGVATAGEFNPRGQLRLTLYVYTSEEPTPERLRENRLPRKTFRHTPINYEVDVFKAIGDSRN